MSSKFDACIKFTYVEEGGFQSLVDDNGNWFNNKLIGTNRGISAPVLAEWLGPKGIDLLTYDYMKQLSLTVSDAIYATRYWNAANCEHGVPVGVDMMVNDFAVNDGVHASGAVLQGVLGFSGKDLDGWIGQDTVAALALRVDLPTLIDELTTAQLAYYKTLKKFARFGAIWTARTDRRKAAALRLLTEVN